MHDMLRKRLFGILTLKNYIMRKLLIIAVFIVSSISCMAQTYRYERVYSVNRNTEVKQKSSGEYYITFTSNKNKCFFSDKDGYKPKQSNMFTIMPEYRDEDYGVYRYKGKRNGMLIYQATNRSYSTYQREVYKIEYEYLYFSEDYSKINEFSGDVEYPTVYSPEASGQQSGSIAGSASFESVSGSKRGDIIWVYEERESKSNAQIPTYLY